MHRPTIAIIAGEVSGDQLGGWLMEALKRQQPGIRFIGLGGTHMQTQGLTPLFPMHDIALIGIAEVLPHVRTITRRIREMVEFLEHEQPEMIITIDVPGFALRVLKQLHARGKIRPKLVHYVAPTVWAYRPKRAKIVAERYDHLLCLLPFEPPYFVKEGLATSYVGHEIAWWWKSRGDGARVRAKYGIAAETPILAVFPGSRRGEITRLWPIFRRAIEQLVRDVPTLEIIIQIPADMRGAMETALAGWDVRAHLSTEATAKKDICAAATAALAKSGTIALECALAGVPSVTAYRANPISVFLLRRMIQVKYVNLANLLADRMVVPELLQEHCTPNRIAAALLPLLTDVAARDAQIRELTRISAQLGTEEAHSPSEKAAVIILDMLPACAEAAGGL